MRRIPILLLLPVCATLLVSCHTYTHITIRTVPDAKVLYGSEYYESKSSDHIDLDIANFRKPLEFGLHNGVPFALDYHKRRWNAGDWVYLIVPGIIPGLGLPFLHGMEGRFDQHAYRHRYKYNRLQCTNHDLTFTQPNITYRTPPHLYTTAGK